MRRTSKTSDTQISLFGGDESTSSPAVSPASHSRRQASAKEPTTSRTQSNLLGLLRRGGGHAQVREPMTLATSGRLCLQQFTKSVPDGSWARTFSELLIGQAGWYSSRCALTWRLKVTKSNRSYFQLVASTLHIAGTERSLLLTPTSVMTCERPEDMRARIERKGYRTGTQFGSLMSQIVYGNIPELKKAMQLPKAGLLKTPTVMDGVITTGKKNPVSGNSGTLAQEIASGFVYRRGVLPTPTCFDRKTCKQEVPGRTVTRPSGETFTAGLRMLAYNGLLPTPVTQGLKICEDGKSVFMSPQMLPTPTTQDFKRRGPNSNQQGLPELVRGILPTPKAADGTGGGQNVEGRSIVRPSGQRFSANLRDLAKSDLLPTPIVGNSHNGRRSMTPGMERKLNTGWTVELNDLATLGMLPTPTTSSRNGGTAKEREDGVSRRSELNHLVAQDFGTTSQLSPLFVEQMMGFPIGWILLPFLKESPDIQEPSPSIDGEPKE